MQLIITDGGRAAAGFTGIAGDCVTRAIAIASRKPYLEVYNALNEIAKSERTGKRKRGKSSARNGVFSYTYHKYITSIGGVWTPTMFVGSGCKVHLNEKELPMGRLICNVSKHMVAVIDRVIFDTHDPSRGGTRCVYGYYTLPYMK